MTCHWKGGLAIGQESRRFRVCRFEGACGFVPVPHEERIASRLFKLAAQPGFSHSMDLILQRRAYHGVLRGKETGAYHLPYLAEEVRRQRDRQLAHASEFCHPD